MNENTSGNHEASVITSFPQSYPNDIIDLTEVNDSDEYEVTSSCSVIDSNNSLNSQQPENRTLNSNSADDSISIIYEKILPPPDIEVVNEVIINDCGKNESTINDLLSIPIPPFIMGSFTENFGTEFQQLPPIFPETSSERTNCSAEPINLSSHAPTRALQQTPHYSTLPSCKYAAVDKRPSLAESVIAPCQVALQRVPVPLQSKNLGNLSSHSSDLENSNLEVKVPTIQCGICLDGPDEIATSDRNFISTNCGHVFCNICIKTSLKNANKCPKCRTKVTSRQIRPLYL